MVDCDSSRSNCTDVGVSYFILSNIANPNSLDKSFVPKLDFFQAKTQKDSAFFDYFLVKTTIKTKNNVLPILIEETIEVGYELEAGARNN